MGTKDKSQYYSITRKWGGKKVRNEFCFRIGEWIEQFEESEKEIVLELLKHFQYYTNRKLNIRVRELYSMLLETKGYEQKGTIAFIPPYKEQGVGFSDLFFNMFWTLNELYDLAEKNIYTLLEENCFESLVIVDDYSGTGGTIRKTIKRCIEVNQKCRETKFFVLTSEMSQIAVDKLTKYAQAEKIWIKLISLRITDKAFKKDIFFDEEKAKHMEMCYKKISLNHKVQENYIMGYKETQALIAFEYNTPNNTLGLFWHEDDAFVSIFKRYKKKDTLLSEMQKDLSRRKRQRQVDVFRKKDEKQNYLYLMVYLVHKNLKFNYDEACAEFGMTSYQMDEALNYLVDQKFITVSQGRFVPTLSMKEYVKVTKIRAVNDVESLDDEIHFVEKSYVPIRFEEDFGGY